MREVNVFSGDGFFREWQDNDISAVASTQKAPAYSKPIQLLAIALVENAVTGLRGITAVNGTKNVNARKRLRMKRADEDRNWFLSNEDRECSFVWCCGILGATPDYVRKNVLPLYMTTEHDGRKPKFMRRIPL